LIFGQHARKEVNVELKREADFFGDIVIVPYMDNYDLVVLKTVAICEYGVRTASAKYIMKCDDDTFVRVDAVFNEAKQVPKGRSLYIGNINYYHKPLRYGKWAVTYEVWKNLLVLKSAVLNVVLQTFSLSLSLSFLLCDVLSLFDWL
jgi:hypothetical protein